MIKKKRLDVLVHEQYPQYSRRQIQSWIMQGRVKIGEIIYNKPGHIVSEDVQTTVDIQEPKFVSRAGFKLEKMLDHFSIEVHDLICLDAGLSTGGFTDCLLQHGARKVFGIDVGYGQVHEKIRHDERVVVMERINLRELFDVGQKIDLITLDLSFISVLKVMEAINSLLKDDGQLLILIKPQFEARREQVGRGGLIKDDVVHEQVILSVTQGIEFYGYTCIGVTDSPIEGATGNKEFLGYFKRIKA